MIRGLLLDEARAFICNLKSKDLQYWHVWREEWPDWRPVDEVEGLTEMIHRTLHVSPPPSPSTDEGSLRGVDPEMQGIIEKNFFPKIKQAKDAVDLESQTGSFNITKSQFTIRAKKRYKKRLSVEIEAHDQVFKTHTHDISVGGFFLEDSLPEWISGYFVVRVSKPHAKEQIELN